jgi:hypothetical protein
VDAQGIRVGRIRERVANTVSLERERCAAGRDSDREPCRSVRHRTPQPGSRAASAPRAADRLGDAAAGAGGGGELIGGRGGDGVGGAAHGEGAAGDLEHGDVVDPVADGDGVGGGAAGAGAQRGEGGALGGPGGADEDGVLARVRADGERDGGEAGEGAQRGVGGGDGVGIADGDGGERRGGPRGAVLDDAEVGRPGAHVAGEGAAGVAVMDAVGVEDEAGEAVVVEGGAQRGDAGVGDRVMIERGVGGEIDEVAALDTGDGALDRAGARAASTAPEYRRPVTMVTVTPAARSSVIAAMSRGSTE